MNEVDVITTEEIKDLIKEKLTAIQYFIESTIDILDKQDEQELKDTLAQSISAEKTFDTFIVGTGIVGYAKAQKKW